MFREVKDLGDFFLTDHEFQRTQEKVFMNWEMVEEGNKSEAV